MTTTTPERYSPRGGFRIISAPNGNWLAQRRVHNDTATREFDPWRDIGGSHDSEELAWQGVAVELAAKKAGANETT